MTMGSDEAVRRTDPPGPAPESREAVIGAGITWLSRWTLRWLVIALGAVAVGWIIQQLWSILLPILLALILTTVLQPLARWMESRLRFPPVVAALGTIVVALLVVAGVVVFVAPSVSSQAGEIAESAADGLTQLQEWVQQSDLAVTSSQVDSVVEAAQERLRSSASTIASGVLVGVSAVTSALITMLLTLVLSFFFLKDGRRFLPWLRDLTGQRVGGHLSEVGSRAWGTLGDFVRTQALVGLIDAVLIGAGLLVVGVPLALPLAALTFVAAFAPIIGAVTVGGLAVLVALVANGWVAAVIVLVIVLVVQQLEGNVFLPWLQGKSLHLHAGVVLLTVVLGSTLFGVAGAFLGVPLVAVGAVVLRYLDDQVTEATAPAAPAAPVEEDTAPVAEDPAPGRE
jgi:putative heme transporter